jgi:hypothetical protein
MLNALKIMSNNRMSRVSTNRIGRKEMRNVCGLLAMAAMLCFGLFATNANAQIISHGDLFGPGAPPPQFGVELGLASHHQAGTYLAACDCEFVGGTGTGFIGNIFFELPLNYEWVIGLKAGINFMNTSSRTSIREQAFILYQGGSDSEGTVTFDRVGDIKTTYLTFTPFVKYQFFRLGPFVQAGLGVGLLMSNHFTHHRELTSSTATLDNGSVVNNLRFANGTMEETLEDGPITDVKSLRLGLQIGAGYDISVNDHAVIAPTFTYDLPLSTVRDTRSTGWKISSLYGTIALKYKLD